MPEKVTNKRNWYKLWKAITLDDWHEIVSKYCPNNSWGLKGDRIVGLCPYHDEQTPSFNLIPEKGFGYCFGCQKYINNPLAFISHISGQTTYHVIRELKNNYDVNFEEDDVKRLQQLEQNDYIKTAIYRICNTALCACVVNQPEYAKETLTWLKQRKIDLNLLHMCPLGILPPRNLLSDYAAQIGYEKIYPGIFEYLQNCYASGPHHKKYEGWLVFFNFTTPTTIGRIKLREPSAAHNFYIIDDKFQTEVGVFGLNMFPETRPQFETKTVYIVEGEFDALAIILQQLQQGTTDIFVVSSGGALTDELDFLVKEIGFAKIRLIGDNDIGGNKRVENWIKNNNSPIEVFCWPPTTAKDPDEFIRQNPNNIAYFRNDKNFIPAIDWVVQQFEKAISVVPKENQNRQIELAIEYGNKLKDPISKDVFIKHVLEKYQLPSGSIEREIRCTSEEGIFIRQLERELEKIYLFMSADSTDKGTVEIKAWSRRRRQLTTLIRGGRGLRATIELDTGKIDEFVENTIGIPDFIKFQKFKKGAKERSQNNVLYDLSQHLENALANIAFRLPSATHFETVGQGVHFLSNENNEYELYIINGDKFFHGRINKNSVTYKEFDAPFNKLYVFKSSNNAWSEHIKRLEDLLPCGINPKETYKTLFEIYNNFWKFGHQEYDAQFLAALTLYLPVASLFKHMIFVDISGPTHSGKSSLMQALGGGADSRYKLCEATTLLENYSAAGIRQFMANNRLCLLLDEFEDKDIGTKADPKSRAVREILELVRSGSSGASYVRGTAGGEALTGKINFCLIVSGIYTMQEVQDLNRFVHIATKQVPGWKSPLLRLQEKFSIDDIKNLRRAITLGFLPHIAELLQVNNEIQNEFMFKQNLDPDILDRQLRSYLPIAAVLKYLDEDYKTFIKEFSKLKAEKLAALGGMEQLYKLIWSAILDTPISFLSKEGMISITGLLNTPMGEDTINRSDLGVRYIAKHNWLVVIWRKVVDGILKFNARFKGHVQSTRLKNIADEHPNVIPTTKISKEIIENDIMPTLNNLSEKSIDQITVLDLNKFEIGVCKEIPGIEKGVGINVVGI